MNEFSISIDLVSETHTLREIGEIIGESVSDDSLEPQMRGNVLSCAVFRLDCGTATEFGALVDRLIANQKYRMHQIAAASEKGIEACVNIAVFTDKACTTVGFSAEAIAAIAGLGIPLAVTFYPCNED